MTGRNFSRTDLERSSASGAATSGLLCMAIVGAAWVFDEISGGFEESRTSEGPSANPPRRARVQARHIYSFARAANLGWRQRDAYRLVTDRLKYFFARYRWSDGLSRALVAADGSPLDDRAFLYDQVFVRDLWYERLTVNGQFVQQPAPATSFYHIVCAIGELAAVLEAA